MEAVLSAAFPVKFFLSHHLLLLESKESPAREKERGRGGESPGKEKESLSPGKRGEKEKRAISEPEKERREAVVAFALSSLDSVSSGREEEEEEGFLLSFLGGGGLGRGGGGGSTECRLRDLPWLSVLCVSSLEPKRRRRRRRSLKVSGCFVCDWKRLRGGRRGKVGHAAREKRRRRKRGAQMRKR